MTPRSAAYPRLDYTVPLLAGAVQGEAIDVKGSSQVVIADLSAVALNATFGNGIYVPTLAEGDRVLVQFAASRDGIEPTSTAHCGLFLIGAIVAGIAPLTRAPIAYGNGSLVYDAGNGPTQWRGWSLSCAEPLVLDTTTQEWIAQPATSWFSSWAFFSTGEWLIPTKADHDRDWFVVTAGQESHWKCVRTATNTYRWVVLWSAWYGTTVAKPAASVAYDGLRYYDTDLARLETCARTAAGAWAWEAISGAIAPAGTGPVEVIAGAYSPSPAVLGAPRMVRRVNDAGTALEDWDPERTLKVETFFPYDSAEDVPGYYALSSMAVTVAEEADTIVTPGGAAPQSAFGDSYVSESAGLGAATIPAGVWEWVVWASVDSVAGSTTVLDALIYVRTAAGVETLIATLTTATLTATAARYVAQATLGADTAINVTDRLVVKVRGRRTVGANQRTVTWYHGGSARFSYLRTPVVGDVAVSRRDLDATRRTVLTLAAPPWALVAGATAPAPTIEAGPVLRSTYSIVQAGEVAAAVTASSATLAIAPLSWSFRVTARLAALTNGDANTQLWVVVEDAARNYCWGVRSDIGAVGGPTYIGEAITAAFGDNTTTVPTAGDWLRLTFRRGYLSLEIGVGATLGTAVWSHAGSQYWQRGGTAAVAVPTVLRVAVASPAAPAAALTVDVSDVTWDDLEEVA